MGSVSLKDDFLEIVALLAEQENMEVTFKEVGKGTLIAAAATLIGGLVAGPVGLFFGGTIGGAAAALSSKKFKSVAQIIRHDMTFAQREKLEGCLTNALQNAGRQENIMLVLPLLMSSDPLKAIVLKELGNFLVREMGMITT